MAATTEKKTIRDIITGIVSHYWQVLIGIIAAVVGIIAIMSIVSSISERREEQAVLIAEDIQALYSDFSAAEDDEEKTGLRSEIEDTYSQLKTEYANTYGAQRGHFVMGGLYYNDEEFSKAAETFRIIGDKFPKSYLVPVSYMNAAAAYEENGQLEDALTLYRTVMSDYTDSPLSPKAYFSAARINESLERTDEALDIYNEILQEYPTSNWTKFARTRIIQLENVK